jgi:hypothetical protein
MSSVVLVVVAVAGLSLACVLTASGWDARRPPPLEIDPRASRSDRLTPVLRRASALFMAGGVAGVLVLGLGSRLMMRVLAATSSDSAQGRLTDADEIVGEVTFDGTVGFVVFIGFFAGMITIGVWAELRRWLPERSVAAGVVVAAIGAGALARPSGLIDPGNHDFVILSPVWLAILLSMMVLLTYGVCFAVLADRWADTWPTPALTPRGVLATLPLLVAFAMGVLVVVPAIIIVVVVCFAAWRRPPSDRTRRRLQRSETPGRRVVAAAALVGALWVGVSAVQVLAL